MNISFWHDGKEFTLNLKEESENGIRVELNGKTYRVSVEILNEDEVLLNINGRIYDAMISPNAGSYSVYVNGRCFRLEKKTATRILGGSREQQKRRDIKTSMPGKIVKVFMKEGDVVEEGQAVLILEAMKMQNEIKSPQSGTLKKIGPAPGDSVEAGALLFVVE